MASLAQLSNALNEVRLAADKAEMDTVSATDLWPLLSRAFRDTETRSAEQTGLPRAELLRLLAVGFEILARGE